MFNWLDENMYQPLGVQMASHFSVYSVMKSALENAGYSPFIYYKESLDEDEFLQRIKYLYQAIIMVSVDAYNERFGIYQKIIKMLQMLFFFMNYLDQKLRPTSTY